MPPTPRSLEAELDDETPIGELVERAIEGARALASEEATLVLLELGEDGRAIRRSLVLALGASVACAAAIAWAGVALAQALSLGPLGLALFSLAAAALGSAGVFAARRALPSTILGQSRERLERRLARVTESLR